MKRLICLLLTALILFSICACSKKKEEAKVFVDYILSSAQCDIAVLNSMYPTNKETVLPDAFDYAPKPAKLYKSGSLDSDASKSILDSWSKVMVE